jgi:hypothetical protein
LRLASSSTDHANSVMGRAVSLVERAIALSDLALGRVKKHGSWHQAGPARLLIAERGDLMIAHRIPFQERLPVSAEVNMELSRSPSMCGTKKRAFFSSNGMMTAQPMSCRIGPAIGNMN